jgi:hypothetical protein
MTIEKQRAQLRFILNGFKQDAGFRLFAFQCVEVDNSRTDLTVRVDLSLIRVYGICVQDLPLLCRGLLERRTDSEAVRALTFTEGDMRQHRADRIIAEEAAKKRKQPRSSPPGNGVAWRGGSQFSQGNQV